MKGLVHVCVHVCVLYKMCTKLFFKKKQTENKHIINILYGI